MSSAGKKEEPMELNPWGLVLVPHEVAFAVVNGEIREFNLRVRNRTHLPDDGPFGITAANLPDR